MSKQNQHRKAKGEVRLHGATFRLNEPGKFVPKPKPSRAKPEEKETKWPKK
jgi:hypothetical protein